MTDAILSSDEQQVDYITLLLQTSEKLELLEARLTALEERIDEKWVAFYKEFFVELERLHRDITQDRLRITALEHPATSKTDELRAERIKSIIDARRTVSYAELRGMLHITKHDLRDAIKTLMELHPDTFDIKRSSTDKRARYLIKLPHPDYNKRRW